MIVVGDTCQHRVEAELAGRIEQLKAMQAAIDLAEDDDDARDDAEQTLNEFPLHVDTKTTMVILLSTGGPGDQIEVEIEKVSNAWERADTHVTYRFMDWFDGATTRTDDEDILRYVDGIIECWYPEG